MVKNKYDPQNIFTCYHCVGYNESTLEDPLVCPLQSCSCSNTPDGSCAKVASLIDGSSINSGNESKRASLIFFFYLILSLNYVIRRKLN